MARPWLRSCAANACPSFPAPAVATAMTGWPASAAAPTRAARSTQIHARERWPGTVRRPVDRVGAPACGPAPPLPLGAAVARGRPAAGAGWVAGLALAIGKPPLLDER